MFERIYPFVFAGQTDAGQSSIAHGFGCGVVDLAANPDEGTIFFQQFLQGGRIQPQKRGKGESGVLRIAHFTGIGIDRSYLYAAGQHLTIAIIYGSSPCFHQLSVCMLAHGLFGKFGAHDDLDIKGPAPQHNPEHAEKNSGNLKTQRLPVSSGTVFFSFTRI